MKREIPNAYSRPRFIAPGCQHRLGCKCDPPYWLREPSDDELRFEVINNGWMYNKALCLVSGVGGICFMQRGHEGEHYFV